MPVTTQDYSAIEEARKRAGALGERALSLQAGAETFSDRVMKDVRSARAERGTSLLAQDIGTTTGQLVTGGPEMRGRMAEVSPLQTDIMTARERAGTIGTLATQAQTQLGITGTIQDVIGGGVNQLKSAALLKQAEAQKAAEEANTLLEQVQLKEAQINREFEEWATRERISQGWAGIGDGGGGAGITDAILALLLGGQVAPGEEMEMPTEPKPTTTPSRRGVEFHSSGGQWMWDWETENWYPVVL